MAKYLQPGVYFSQVDYSLYSPKQSLKDFVNSQNIGYKRVRNLRAKWSVENRAGLKSIHGLDAEKELTEALADQLRNSIDKEIMKGLYAHSLRK